MIGYRYPVQGLQPFTKTFGQPLHEPDMDEYNSNETQPQLSQQNNDIVVDAKYVASQIEKSMGFSYGDDSDGDDSDTSVRLEKNVQQPISSESNDDFLTAHSDILPADAPIDTINTLKALKFHIETSENRCFTNLERQLLATIVQHGIFNANKEENAPNSHEQDKVNEHVQKSGTLHLDHATATVDKENENRDDKPSSNLESMSIEATQPTHSPTTQFPPNLEKNNIEEGFNPNSQTVQLKVINCSQSSITQVPPHLEENYIRENNTPDALSISRRALLPTPGSYEEVSHVIMSENEGFKNFSKPTLPINEQKKMSKAVKSLKISEKLARIQNSYHPDDEPTLQLLESMANKNDEESGYEDLLASYSKTKSQLQVGKEPKYKSKTKIIPPSSEFLKRQEKHHASRHERQEKMHYDSQNYGSNTNRRVVRREEYEREKRSKEQERESSRRRVKVHYKEDTPDSSQQNNRSLPNQETERRKKSKSPEKTVEKNTDACPDEEAVDILANLITQKFLSTMTEVDEQNSEKNADSVLHSIAESAVQQTLAQPSSTLPINFPTPPAPFIPGNPPFLPPPPHLMATPILSAPLPIVTGPMMVHPGPVKRSNLITINLDNKKHNKKKNIDSKDATKDYSTESSSAQVSTNQKAIIVSGDIEEGEIS